MQALMGDVPRHDAPPDAWHDEQWLLELKRHDYNIARLHKALDIPENTVRDRLKRCEGYVPVSGRSKDELERICDEESWRVSALRHRLQASEAAIRDRLRRVGLEASRLV